MKPGGWIRFAPWVLAAAAAWLGATRPAVPDPERLRLAGVGVSPTAPVETVPADLREPVLPASVPDSVFGEGRIAGPVEPRGSASWRGASAAAPSPLSAYVPPPPNPGRGRGDLNAPADSVDSLSGAARERGIVAPGTPTPWGWLAADVRALDERAARARQSDPRAAGHPGAWMDWAMDSFDDENDSRSPAPSGAWPAPDRLGRDASP